MDLAQWVDIVDGRSWARGQRGGAVHEVATQLSGCGYTPPCGDTRDLDRARLPRRRCLARRDIVASRLGDEPVAAAAVGSAPRRRSRRASSGAARRRCLLSQPSCWDSADATRRAEGVSSGQLNGRHASPRRTPRQARSTRFLSVRSLPSGAARNGGCGPEPLRRHGPAPPGMTTWVRQTAPHVGPSSHKGRCHAPLIALLPWALQRGPG